PLFPYTTLFRSPGLLNTLGIISGENSGLYAMASRYLLPASLVLFTLSIDFKGILKLGPKALIMFLAGTVGVIIGGPIALLTVSFFYQMSLPEPELTRCGGALLQ